MYLYKLRPQGFAFIYLMACCSGYHLHSDLFSTPFARDVYLSPTNDGWSAPFFCRKFFVLSANALN